MSIKIEKGIPLPLNGVRGRNRKYPWDELEVGESFLADAKSTNSLTLCRMRAAKRLGRVFISRTTHEGVRVWRVS